MGSGADMGAGLVAMLVICFSVAPKIDRGSRCFLPTADGAWVGIREPTKLEAAPSSS